MKAPQHAVITGASAGIGRATALYFAKKGTKVTLIARSEEGLKSAADEIKPFGGQVHCKLEL